MHITAPPRVSTHDPRTGEVLTFRESGPGIWQAVPDSLVFAAKRWKLKYHVTKLLGLRSRQSRCHRWRVPKQEIQVQRSLVHDQTFFSGLEICGSVWLCPLCASKISERRCNELKSALESAKEKKLWPQLLTLTFPHYYHDTLGKPGSGGILDQLLNAYTYRMMQGRAGVTLKRYLNFAGTIRALEVTHGLNGWHPHLHILVFSRLKSSLRRQQLVWTAAWRTACKRAGLPEPSAKFGCTLKNGDYVAEYVSKWGLQHELTKSHVKTAGEKGASPWDLLRLSSGETWPGMPEYSPSHASQLWRVYAEAFFGRRQLYPSPGLKKLLNFDLMTDEQLAHEDLDTAAAVYNISDIQWSWIIAAQKEVEILSIARDCPVALDDYIDTLRPDTPLSHREALQQKSFQLGTKSCLEPLP